MKKTEKNIKIKNKNNKKKQNIRKNEKNRKKQKLGGFEVFWVGV